MKIMQTAVPLGLCSLLLAACTGSGNGSSIQAPGGKSSTAPLLINLQANPSPAWLNAAVTFTVSCVGASTKSSLSYTWTFGDGTTVGPTPIPTASHAYGPGGATTNGKDTYQYGVTCTDSADPSTPTSVQASLDVWQYDLSTVAVGSCSSGVRGWGWCWQNPLPTGANLLAVSATSPLNAWAVGTSGAVVTTVDGSTWVPLFPWNTATANATSIATGGPATDVVTVRASDQYHATIIAGDGSLYSTSDGGATWVPLNSPPGNLALTIGALIDPNNAWAFDGKSLWQYQSGAWTSNATFAALGLTAFNSSLTALDVSHVWFSTSGSLFNAVTNHSETIPAGFTVNSVSATQGSVCGNGQASAGTLWASNYLSPLQQGKWRNDLPAMAFAAPISEAQPTWTASSVNQNLGFAYYWTNLEPLKAFDQQTAWAVGGGPWNLAGVAIFPDDPVDLIGVDFNGFSYINSQTNGAWVPSLPIFSPTLNALDSADCIHGWAAGASGALLATVDGAQTWQRQAQSSQASAVIGTYRLGSVAAVSDSVAYVTGSMGVYATLDGGLTWKNLVRVLTPSDLICGATGSCPTISQGYGIQPPIANNAAGYAVAYLNSANDSGDGQILDISPGAASVATSDLGLLGGALSIAVCKSTAWVVASGTQGNVVVFQENLLSGQLPNWTTASPPPGSPVGFVCDDAGNAAAYGVAASGFWISSYSQSTGSWSPESSLPLPLASVAPNGEPFEVPVISAARQSCSSSALPGSKCTLFALGADKVNGGLGIYRSENGGQTWSQGTLPLKDSAGHSISNWLAPGAVAAFVNSTAVAAADGENAWVMDAYSYVVAGANGTQTGFALLHTKDGTNWNIEPITLVPPQSIHVYSIAAVDPNTAWVVGGNGSVLKTKTAGCAPAQSACMP